MRPLLSFSLAALALLLNACTFTAVRDTWASPDVPLTPLNRVVILSATGSPARRAQQNSLLAKALETRGVMSSLGDAVVPSGYYDKDKDGRVDKDVDGPAILKYLRSKGEVRAFVINGEPVRTKISASQPALKVEGGERFDEFSQQWVRVVEAQETVPAPVVEKDYRMTLNLYDLNSGRLIWQARTSTVDPADRKDLLQAFSTAMLAAMDNAGLLPKGP